MRFCAAISITLHSRASPAQQFLAYLQENLLNRFPGIVTRDQVNAWILSPGLPADAVLPVTDLFQPVDEARDALACRQTAAEEDRRGLGGAAVAVLSRRHAATLTVAQMADLDKAFGFSKSPNAEIGHSWFILVIVNNYQPGFPRLEEYLKTIGRRKLIEPLYESLMKTPAGTEVAKRVFAKARPGYHPETVKAIEAIVDPKEESSE